MRNPFRSIWLVILAMPLPSLAQTSGPSTPEVQRFVPGSTKNLVNLFTGDLNYNINLLELDGGYPINLSYSSGVRMMDEASDVGWGWQLNIGRINRTVRGLPDDFRGDELTRTLNQQKQLTIDINGGLDVELFGTEFLKVGLNTGVSFSNKLAHRASLDLSTNLSASLGSATVSGGLTLGTSNQDGASIGANAGLSYLAYNVGLNGKYNFMEGTRSLDLSASTPGLQTDFPLLMARQPFHPTIEFPNRTLAGSFKFRAGGEVWGVSLGGYVAGKYATQQLATDRKTLSGYGLMYLQDAADLGAMLDYAGEKEGPVLAEEKALPLHFLTPDIFDVSAQGLSGSFRAFRTDLGVTHSEPIDESGTGASFGGEYHGGAYFHGGIDITPSFTSNYSGSWKNSAAQALRFSGNPSDQHLYFKNMADVSPFTSQLSLTKLGEAKPLSVPVGDGTMDGLAALRSAPLKNKEMSGTVFSYLTENEALMANMPLESYAGFGAALQKTPIPRVDPANRKGHHIAVIRITRNDGVIFEFGIAAYVLTQHEVSFNVEEHADNHRFDKVTGYDAADNSTGNQKGRDHYYSDATVSPYAYAYLLTAVYSPDYVDLTGDGPTPDDLGKYTRFNYTRTHINFKWRTPYKGANYTAANLSDVADDIGSYISGSKEIWTLHSIETKNYEADLEYAARTDALAVADEANGGQGNGESLEQVKTIRLYARAATTKEPVKTVQFEYDRSLCPGIQAGTDGKGKLTLRKLYLTYGNSKKGLESYYAFGYGTDNLPFAPAALDGWGVPRLKAHAQPEDNGRFPITQQDSALAGEAARSWQLSEIRLPAGGTLNIHYEAKDYAYVQDRPAMKMYKIVGFAKDASTPVGSLYDNDGNANNFLVIDVQKPVTAVTLPAYFTGIQQLYVNCLLTMGSANGQPLPSEEVSGYFDLAGTPVPYGPCGTCVAVPVKPARDNSNAVCWALWQKIRKSLSQVIDPPELDATSSDLQNVFTAISHMPGAVLDAVKYIDMGKKMRGDARGKELDPNNISYARLLVPDGRKLGGGARVKRITLTDNWKTMTGASEQNAVYGQLYTYETAPVEGKPPVSSGVATYEPIGNMENPFLLPTLASNEPLAADLYYFRTEPFGESFFPAPMVGYSRVVVTDLPFPASTALPGANRNRTGVEVDEFYTTRDFPTIVRQTPKQAVMSGFTLLGNRNTLTASQGFYIEVNDINGKPRARKLYAATDNQHPVSGVEYRYLSTGGTLSGSVSTVNPFSGKVSTGQLGFDYDLFVHTSESDSYVFSPSVHMNLDVIPFIFGAPLPIFMIWPAFNQSLLQCKTITTTKVVYRNALLGSVINYDHGSALATENRLYDAVTGETITTATEDGQGGWTYRTALPAWWFYAGMGPAKQEHNWVNVQQAMTQGRMYGGDAWLLNQQGKWRPAWVYENSRRQQQLIGQSGSLVPMGATDQARLLRSGRHNQLQDVGIELLSANDPVRMPDSLLHFDRIVQLSATAYGQRWQAYGSYKLADRVTGCSCKPVFHFEDFGVHIDTSGRVSGSAGYLQSGNQLVLVHRSDCDTATITLDRILPDHLSCAARLTFTLTPPAPDLQGCSLQNTAQGAYQLTDSCTGAVLQKGSFTMYAAHCTLWDCHPVPLDAPGMDPNLLNPYLHGILGSWRLSASYQHVGNRRYTTGAQREQGFFDSDSLTYSPGSLSPGNLPSLFWQRSDSVIIYDPHGSIVERINALKIPRGNLWGYRFSLPVTESSNAHYYEMAAEGFEDQDYLNNLPAQSVAVPHFRFSSTAAKPLSTEKSHTGRRSLLVQPGDQVSLERQVAGACAIPFTLPANDQPAYSAVPCDYLTGFTPRTGAVYQLSLWLHEKRDPNTPDQATGSITVEFLDAGGQPLLPGTPSYANGVIADGWQQLTTTLSIPPNAQKIRLKVQADSMMYVDDVRLQPLDASLKTYVFDPVTLHLMAELDPQNFATFYEYDQEGQLARVKRETEGGIVTLKENRTAQPKKP